MDPSIVRPPMRKSPFFAILGGEIFNRSLLVCAVDRNLAVHLAM